MSRISCYNAEIRRRLDRGGTREKLFCNFAMEHLCGGSVRARLGNWHGSLLERRAAVEPTRC
jgi:hypothetical protein